MEIGTKVWINAEKTQFGTVVSPPFPTTDGTVWIQLPNRPPRPFTDPQFEIVKED